jgi:hypothetical protein
MYSDPTLGETSDFSGFEIAGKNRGKTMACIEIPIGRIMFFYMNLWLKVSRLRVKI